MGLLLTSGRVTRQPVGRAAPDRGNTLTHGMDIAFMRLDQPSLVGAVKLTKAGTPAVVARKFGVGHEFATSSDLFQMSGAPSLPDGSEYTWLVVYQPSATSSTGFFVNGDGTTRMFQFRHNGATPEFILFNNPTAVAVQVNGTALTVGKPVNIAVRVTTTTVTMYQDGRQTATGGYSGTARGLTAPNEIQIGNRGGSFAQGSIGAVLRWPRALTDAEMVEATRNPWQVASPAPRRLLFAVAGGATDTPLNPGAGAVIVAGYAPTIARTANQTVSPAAGAVIVAGYAPTITRTAGQAVAPSAGVIAVAGYAPTVTRTNNQAVAPAAGNLIVAGYAPTITRSVTGSVNPAPGAIAVTGYAPTITRTAGNSVQPGRGQISVIGYAPSLYQGAPASYPQFNMYTIMRHSSVDAQAAAMSASLNAQGGTMSAAMNIPTIMSGGPVNAAASISSAAINRTAVLL